MKKSNRTVYRKLVDMGLYDKPEEYTGDLELSEEEKVQLNKGNIISKYLGNELVMISKVGDTLSIYADSNEIDCIFED